MALYAIKRKNGFVSICCLTSLKQDIKEEIEKFQSSLKNELALDANGQYEYREISSSELPVSKNYRNAWTDDFETDTIDIDLEKAKEIQSQLIIEKAYKRAVDKWGNVKKLTKQEIEDIDLSSAKTVEELYNMWPKSIDKRNGKREYIIHKKGN